MIKAIIIDDEEKARNTLASFVKNFCEGVEIVAACPNVPEGVIAIHAHQPELVFLDVEMPEYSGFDLLNFFSEIHFEIVFVTAFSEYAIRAFEVSAIDYLLKPVDIDQLIKAVEKVKAQTQTTTLQKRFELLKENHQSNEIRKMALPMAEGLKFVEIAHIVLIEADGAYSNVVMEDRSRILVSKKLKFFEDRLVNKKFIFRAHRSYLINLNHLTAYTRGENTLTLDNGQTVSLSRDKKPVFEALLKELNLST